MKKTLKMKVTALAATMLVVTGCAVGQNEQKARGSYNLEGPVEGPTMRLQMDCGHENLVATCLSCQQKSQAAQGGQGQQQGQQNQQSQQQPVGHPQVASSYIPGSFRSDALYPMTMEQLMSLSRAAAGLEIIDRATTRHQLMQGFQLKVQRRVFQGGQSLTDIVKDFNSASAELEKELPQNPNDE